MNAAARALEALVELLEDADVTPTRDAANFAPAPIGVLVGLPTKVGGTLSASTFEIPVLVVSGEPVNNADAVDRLYEEADAIANVTRTLTYRPTTWAGSDRVDPLAALEVTVTLTVEMEA